MKKIFQLTAITLLIMCTGFISHAQKKTDPRHANFYKNARFETEEIIVEIVDATAQMEWCKMKIKITNKTNDYIIYKPAETEFVFDFGTYNPKGGSELFNGKNEFIGPKESDSRVITVKGDNRFHVESFSVNFKGFYRISSKGKVFNAPDFQLPASSNDFTAGPFKVLMTAVEKETKQTSVRFKITYSNDPKHYGILNEGKPVLKIEDGREFAMVNQKDKANVMEDGKEEKFNVFYQIPGKIVDMQFATMHLVWKDTFTESEAVMVKTEPVKFVIDPGMTDAKNK